MAHPIVFVKEEESPKCTVFVKEEESPKCTVCLTLKLCIKKPLALPPDFHLFMEVRNTLFHNVSFLREQEWYNKLMIGPDSSFAQWTRNLQFEFGKLTQQHCNLLGVSLLHNKKNEMPGIQLHSFTMHEWRFCGTTKHKTLHNILDCRSRDAVFRTIRDAAAKGHASVQLDKDLFLSPVNFILLPTTAATRSLAQEDDKVYDLWRPYCTAQTWSVQASANGLIKIDTVQTNAKRKWTEFEQGMQKDVDDDYGIETQDMHLAKKAKCSVCGHSPPVIM